MFIRGCFSGIGLSILKGFNCGLTWCHKKGNVQKLIYVSESDILGPNAYFSDIENLVSFERAMFEDFNFKIRTKIFLLFMSISPL